MNTDQCFKIDKGIFYTEYRIDKGVPFPEKPPAPPKIIYPLVRMKVGDSFLIQTDIAEAQINSVRRRIDHQIVRDFGKAKNSRVFRCKVVDNGIRVWRIS